MGVARQQVGALDLPRCSSISLLDVARYLDRLPPSPTLPCYLQRITTANIEYRCLVTDTYVWRWLY